MPHRVHGGSYGKNKYCAFHLLLARWIRHAAANSGYNYVTLGGPELRDVLSIAYIDAQLMKTATSYETRGDKYATAHNTAVALATRMQVSVIHGDFFDRQGQAGRAEPTIFFVDLECACEGGHFPGKFATLLQDEG